MGRIFESIFDFELYNSLDYREYKRVNNEKHQNNAKSKRTEEKFGNTLISAP